MSKRALVLRAAQLAVAALLLVGCGGEESQTGSATLWVTRDRGDDVLLVRTVPAGITALQALRGEADVETRYGGRFVQSIEGLSGSSTGRRDWFYFVNGLELDRGATEYRLHRGDILWWDFRSWARTMRAPVVVGAFPEPFLHGFDGKRRRAVVRAEAPALLPAARALARVVRGRATLGTPPDGANVLVVKAAPIQFSARGSDPGSPVEFRINAEDAIRLAGNPELARFRYEGLP